MTSDPITARLSKEIDVPLDNDCIADAWTYCHVFLDCIWSRRKPVWGSRNCHDLANWLSYYLYFFSFLIYNYKMECGKVSRDFVTMSQWCDRWSQMVKSQVTVTECHMTRITWGLWESKCIATVVKCISSRELNENSIEFSLSNTDKGAVGLISALELATLTEIMGKSEVWR